MATDKFFKIKVEDIERLTKLTIEKDRLKADKAHDHRDEIDRIETDISKILRSYHLKNRRNVKDASNVLSYIDAEIKKAVAESDRDVLDSGDEGKRWTDDQIAKRVQIRYLGRQIDWLEGIDYAAEGLVGQLEKNGISHRVIEMIQNEDSIDLDALARNDPKKYKMMKSLRDAYDRKLEAEEIVRGNEEALGYDYGEDEPERESIKPAKTSIFSRMRAGLRDAFYKATDRIPFVRRRREKAAAEERREDGLDEIKDIQKEMQDDLKISEDDTKALANLYGEQMQIYMHLKDGDPAEVQAKIEELRSRLVKDGVDGAKLDEISNKLFNACIQVYSAISDDKKLTAPRRVPQDKGPRKTSENEETKQMIEKRQKELETVRKELEGKGVSLETLNKYLEVRGKKLGIADKTSEEFQKLDDEQKSLYEELFKGVADVEGAKKLLLRVVALNRQIESLEKKIEKTTEDPENRTEWNDSGRNPKKDSKGDTQIDYGSVTEAQKKELDAFFDANKKMLLSEEELGQDLFKGQFKRYGTMTKGDKVVPFMHFSFDTEQPIPGDEANKRNVVVTFIVTTDGIKRLTALPTKNRDISQTEFNDSAINPSKMTPEDGGILYDQSLTTEGTDLVEMEYLKKSETGKYSYMKTTETGTMTINMGTKPLKGRDAVISLNDYAERRKQEVIESIMPDKMSFKDEKGAVITGDKPYQERYYALQKFLNENGLTKEALSSSDFITSGTGTYTRNSTDSGFKDLKFLAFTYNKENPGQGPIAIDLSSGLEGSVTHTRYIKCKDGYIDPERVTFDKDGKPSPIVQLTDIIKEAKKMELNGSFMDRVMKQQTERRPLISREDQKIADLSRRFKNQPTKDQDGPDKDAARDNS